MSASDFQTQHVIMGPIGEIAIAIPLYTQSKTDTLEVTGKWVIAFSTQRPVGYAIDYGAGDLQLVNAEIVNKRCEFLADL